MLRWDDEMDKIQKSYKQSKNMELDKLLEITLQTMAAGEDIINVQMALQKNK